MNGVCAIVVTYQPAPEVTANLAALRPQVDRLVVVDNAASDESRGRFAPWRDDPGFVLIANDTNRGLAAALNQGLAVAMQTDAEWVATFDQDSTAPADFIAGLLAAHANHPARDRVGLVAPVYHDRHLGFVYSASRRLERDARVTIEAAVAMTSGNLVLLRAVRDAGIFREDFFIDCVDLEFSLRLRRRGWIILETREVELGHRQGVWTRRRFLWLTPKFNDYPAARRYYQTRNRLVMYARYATSSPRWVLRDAWHYPKEILKLVLYGQQRGPKLRAILLGAWHALSGRRGPWPPEA